jgi:2-polyprenyl-3-methyl-5-hydroxy-6-metoxy-1,4-benzoquinol methylase
MEISRHIPDIMRAHGATCTLEEFQSAVNLAFHRFESSVYDQIHGAMWKSLPAQFELLSQNVIRATPGHAKFRLLDVGCGTGLSSDLLLQTDLGHRVTEVHLLDTSREMLDHAQRRSRNWTAPATTHEGTVEDLPVGEHFHLVLICSVLHHIPDLGRFFGRVAALQEEGDCLMHLQDPNGDFLKDPTFEERKAMASERAKATPPHWLRRLTPSRIIARAKRELTGTQPESYITLTNTALLSQGVIRTPMSANEIWAVTDIHVHDGLGISVSGLRTLLPAYRLIAAHSYGFFGALASELPPDLQEMESELSAGGSENGSQCSAAWIKVGLAR